MACKKSIEVVVGVPIQQCFTVLQEVGAAVEEYQLVDSSPRTFTLIWRQGWGRNNPIRVRVDLKPIGNAQTEVCFSALVEWAIADPFNLTTKAIKLFEKPFRQRITKVPSDISC